MRIEFMIWYVVIVGLVIQSFICGHDAAHRTVFKHLVVMEASHSVQGLVGSLLPSGGMFFVTIRAGHNDAFGSRRDSSVLIGSGTHRSISPRWIALLFLRG